MNRYNADSSPKEKKKSRSKAGTKEATDVGIRAVRRRDDFPRRLSVQRTDPNHRTPTY